MPKVKTQTVKDSQQLATASQLATLFQMDQQYFYKNTDIPRFQTRKKGSVRFDVAEVKAYFTTKR